MPTRRLARSAAGYRLREQRAQYRAAVLSRRGWRGYRSRRARLRVVAGAKRSRTAQGVLAQRAVLTEMGVLADPYAKRMLAPSMAAAVWVVKRWPAPFRTRSVTLAGFAAWVLWFDRQVIDALDAGIAQVAVIGAGYDSRAWRFRRDGVRFFELDHPATQRDKARRAPGPGPNYVQADLTTDDAAVALLEQGFDASRPALFVLEGLTMYLSEHVVADQLRVLFKATARGSRLAVEFHPPRDSGTSRNRRQRLLQQVARGQRRNARIPGRASPSGDVGPRIRLEHRRADQCARRGARTTPPGNRPARGRNQRTRRVRSRHALIPSPMRLQIARSGARRAPNGRSGAFVAPCPTRYPVKFAAGGDRCRHDQRSGRRYDERLRGVVDRPRLRSLRRVTEGTDWVASWPGGEGTVARNRDVR